MKKATGLLIIILFISGLNCYAQDRGRSSIQTVVGQNVSVGKQWAVFIAIDRYKEWGPLSNPVKDAKEIRDILLYNYYIDEVRELYDQDASKMRIQQLFIDLRSLLGKDDSVFIYFAGHGYTDPDTKTGSWIPVDGGSDINAQTNWLGNNMVRNLLTQLPAKHLFLISDSCFSGDLLDVNRGAPPQINSNYYRQAYSKVSRQVMSSGASETVPDASEFSMRLKDGLLRADGECIDPVYLFTKVREVKTTQPLLGSIGGSGYEEGGSFLFFKKQVITLTPQPIPPPVPAPQPVPPPAPSPVPAPAPQPTPQGTLYDQLLKASGIVTIVVTENSQLPDVYLSNGKSITIRGDTAERTITNLGGGIQITVGNGAILTLENITLKGISVNVVEGGTLVMNNASAITGCNGCGVFVDGSFTMNEGRIANNNSSGVAVGVQGSGGSFWMKGGRIENNKDDSYGGGVCCFTGRFYMSGGTISGNWAGEEGGGVYCSDKFIIFSKTGGVIYGSNEGSGNANMAIRGHALSSDIGKKTKIFDKTIGTNQKLDIHL